MVNDPLSEKQKQCPNNEELNFPLLNMFHELLILIFRMVQASSLYGVLIVILGFEYPELSVDESNVYMGNNCKAVDIKILDK